MEDSIFSMHDAMALVPPSGRSNSYKRLLTYHGQSKTLPTYRGVDYGIVCHRFIGCPRCGQQPQSSMRTSNTIKPSWRLRETSLSSPRHPRYLGNSHLLDPSSVTSDVPIAPSGSLIAKNMLYQKHRSTSFQRPSSCLVNVRDSLHSFTFLNVHCRLNRSGEFSVSGGLFTTSPPPYRIRDCAVHVLRLPLSRASAHQLFAAVARLSTDYNDDLHPRRRESLLV
ncbi:hypothetical protein B0H11DRAFT_2274145 [Mycena galericulata]|nr:hypothetical protein B0H11DRAFT_2274145 [Mycena galericulata]